MANLNDATSTWQAGIYQLEQTDPVLGGEPNEGTGAGMDNIPHLQLARRTTWLKMRVDTLLEAVVAASTTVAGIVRLANTLTSGATDLALTAAMGKKLQDEKAPLASPALTGTPTAPTAAADTNTTQLATTAFVLGQAASANPAMNGAASPGSATRYARADHVHPTDSSRAPLASPAFTGTPTAPTPANSDNGTRIATTAWVRSAMAALAVEAGFASSSAANGYIKFPAWLGGIIMQWGSFSITDTSNGKSGTVLLPISYPSGHFVTVLGSTSGKAGSNQTEGVWVTGLTQSSFTWQTEWSESINMTAYYISVGF